MSGAAGDAPTIILCRPQIGENIGAAARAMANFGLLDLRLVRPDCGWPNAKAVVAASGAVSVLNEVRRFDELTPALADLHHIFATTARPRELRKDVLTPADAARRAGALIADGRRVGFMFGAERTGLTNEELLLADAIVSIPVDPRFTSLNLAQAVLVCAYEWHQSGRLERGGEPSVTAADVATKAEVAGLVEHLVRELDAVDFFRSSDRRESLIHAITVLFERRSLTRPEVHLLRGIIKDIAGGRRARQPQT